MVAFQRGGFEVSSDSVEPQYVMINSYFYAFSHTERKKRDYEEF